MSGLSDDLTVCERCGAAVIDLAVHRAWHATLARTRDEVTLTRDEVEHLEEQLLEAGRPYPGLSQRA